MSNKNISDIAILYEDIHCVVINKPSGLMVHSNGKESGPFLTDWIIEHFPMAKGVGEPARSEAGVDLDRSGIVHRLDRDTSGALIIAKTQESHAWLKKQFQDRTVFKKYLAFVWGEIEEEFGTISRSIGRSGSDFRKWTAQRGARGEMRDAETYWTRLWTGISEGDPEERKDGIGNKFSLLEAEPKTGRTHQIRVHFNAIYHPVVGDSLYAPKRPTALGFERLALHSWIFEFENMDGKRIRIQAPFPEDFERAVRELNVPRLHLELKPRDSGCA